MGCDIHMFIEYRVDKGDWQADPHHIQGEDDWDDTDIENIREVTAARRNYGLFGLLAGVRIYSDKMPKPKGLPQDLSAPVKLAAEQWNGDGHSHSWITLKDFKKLLNKHKKELCLKSTKSKEAFYKIKNYRYSHDDKNEKPLMPPNYTTIVNYCEDIESNIDWLTFDKCVLGDKQKHKVDVRLIFWFDN